MKDMNNNNESAEDSGSIEELKPLEVTYFNSNSLRDSDHNIQLLSYAKYVSLPVRSQVGLRHKYKLLVDLSYN